MDVKNTMDRLQNLPEDKKKMIVFVIVGVSALVLAFFVVFSTQRSVTEIKRSVESIKLPDMTADMGDVGLNAEGKKDETAGVTGAGSNESPTNNESVFSGQVDVPKKEESVINYQNTAYYFAFQYPMDWNLDESKTTDTEIWLEKKVDQEIASLHLTVVSATQKMVSSESAIDQSISQMKEIIEPKTKIDVSGSEGYEAIGTICTSFCNSSAEEVYSPFLIAYLSYQNTVVKIKYGEGLLETGWKKTVEDWQHESELKHIISTITFN